MCMEMEGRVLCMLGKCSTTELYPKPEYKFLKSLVEKWKMKSQGMRFFLQELCFIFILLS